MQPNCILASWLVLVCCLGKAVVELTAFCSRYALLVAICHFSFFISISHSCRRVVRGTAELTGTKKVRKEAQPPTLSRAGAKIVEACGIS